MECGQIQQGDEQDFLIGTSSSRVSWRLSLKLLSASDEGWREVNVLLEYTSSRFRALMSGKEENYTDDRVRQMLKGIMPQLEKSRFLHKVKPSADDSVSEIETIFECLPAMWHYQAAELAKPVTEE